MSAFPGHTGRFAPSPTGRLHLGHAYSALLAHDAARAAGGRFLLRIEDIDQGRCRPAYIDAILDDLAWLGVSWDAPPIRQSTRLTAYAEALDTLRQAGLLYPCFCTRKDIAIEIAQADRAPHGPEGALYPGTCRRLDPGRRQALLDSGRPHAWRLDTARAVDRAGGPLDWHDAGAGTVSADRKSVV